MPFSTFAVLTSELPDASIEKALEPDDLSGAKSPIQSELELTRKGKRFLND